MEFLSLFIGDRKRMGAEMGGGVCNKEVFLEEMCIIEKFVFPK